MCTAMMFFKTGGSEGGSERGEKKKKARRIF